MMDVRMPDGTIVTNVPDGTTQEEIMRRYRLAQQPPAAVEDDPGTLQAGVIGAGRTIDQALKGIEQHGRRAVAGVAGALGADALAREQQSKLEAMKATEDENARIYAGLAEKHPVATAAGEAVPLIATLPASGSVTGAALIGSLPGLVSYGTPQEQAQAGALGAVGGAIGAGAGKLVGRALNPIRTSIAPMTEDAAAAAQRLGYTPTAGQQTGNRALQMIEQQAAKNPLAASQAQAFNQANRSAVNTAAARAMGQSADQLTEDTFAAARARLGAEFNRLSEGRSIPLGADFSARLGALRDRLEQAGPFKNAQAAGVLDAADMVAKSGTITGEAYQAIRSELSDMARTATRAGSDKLAASIKGVSTALDSAAEKALGPEDLAAWQKARGQYAAMKTLEKKGAVKAGDVDPAIIRNILQSGDRGAFARGGLQGELADIARIGNAFRPLPDSGTASNWLTQMMLTGGAGMIGPGALATTLATPALASKLLFSPGGRKYLTEGLLKVTPELERRLSAGGYGLLGLPLVGAAQ